MIPLFNYSDLRALFGKKMVRHGGRGAEETVFSRAPFGNSGGLAAFMESLLERETE